MSRKNLAAKTQAQDAATRPHRSLLSLSLEVWPVLCLQLAAGFHVRRIAKKFCAANIYTKREGCDNGSYKKSAGKSARGYPQANLR